ncbi:MAG: tRNA-modifying protein YgfZ [Pseudomonadota bacterium]
MVLENGAARAELFHPAGAEVTCTEDWGHAFQFRSSTAFAAMVYVNGKAAFATHISEGATYLHLPQPQLTGRHSWMEIRDPSGTHVYWSNWILPRWQVTPISVLQAEGRGPYPAELFHQSPYRFRALREHITRGGAPDLLAQLPQAIEALEAGFDRLNGVDFRKGCYVGQEVTARMRHKTELKKRLLAVRVEGSAPAGTPVTTEAGKPAGTLFTQAGGRGLAHLRLDRAKGPLMAGEASVIAEL